MNEITEAQGKEAYQVHQSVLELKRQMGIAFVEMGRLLKVVRDNKYYEVLGYDTFTSYVINSELGFKRRTAYYYVEIYEMFIEELGYKVQAVAQIGYDKLCKALPIVRKHIVIESEIKTNVKEGVDDLSFKTRIGEILTDAQELRPVDFAKKYKDEKKQEDFDDFLSPPEYFRCKKCNKWKIVIPIEDCCEEWLKIMKKKLDKKFPVDNNETTK